MQPEHRSSQELCARQLVERFWTLMSSNQFATVAEVCSGALVVEWPQSRERFIGVERFAMMNHAYPAHGRWQFDVRRLIADDTIDGPAQAVTEVAITDGVQHALAISFFSIEEGVISQIVEYWPEPFAAPANRAHLAQSMDQV